MVKIQGTAFQLSLQSAGASIALLAHLTCLTHGEVGLHLRDPSLTALTNRCAFGYHSFTLADLSNKPTMCQSSSYQL